MPFPHAEEFCWTEKETRIKQENEEAVVVKQEVESEAIAVKKEEIYVRVKEEDAIVKNEKYDTIDTVFGLKDKGEISVILEKEEERGLINIVHSSNSHLSGRGLSSVVTEMAILGNIMLVTQ
ncbi:hypothetical protein UPYG_G00051170 [Umbra pygmaea]|uniref:Uncharacterized protein n=1 Tax=Umbra pygmaea TaxID=75934 RepID=A0ABD0X739_UMBPY